MHIGIQLAGAAHAGLDFVENQHRVMTIAQLAQPLQEFFFRRKHAALALHRLDDHRTGGVVNQLAGRLQIVINTVTDIRRQRCEILRVGRLATRADGKERASVEGIFKRHDTALVGTKLIVRIFARQLQRRFVGFRPRVTEKDFFGKRRVDQFFGQAQRRLVGKAVAGMPKLRRLVIERLTQRRVRMPQRVHRNPTGKVDILFTLLIPQARAFPTNRNKSRRSVNRHHPFIEIFTRN